MPRVLTIESAATFDRAVEEAAACLRAGEVAVTPTETVYGLAANALDARAVGKIFEIKGRPSHNPLIVHVASLDWARRLTTNWPATADALAKAFWPGPLTIVLPRSALVPDAVTGGGATVAIRWPAHPFMRALLQKCDFPLAAPSANLSMEVSATEASHALRALGSKVGLIIDAGPAAVGVESTVVDLTTSPPKVLRPGMITRGQLEAALKQRVDGAGDDGASESALRSPGLLARHYSPRAHLRVGSWRSQAELQRIISGGLSGEGRTARVIAHTNIPEESGGHSVVIIPFDPEAYARALYSELHRADEAGVDLIVVEALPETDEWEAINDRLRRASAN